MTPTFQAQQALRLRHLHQLQQGQASNNDAAGKGRYGDYVFRNMPGPPPSPPPRNTRLPGQRPAGSADRVERSETDTEKLVEEGGAEASGEERIGAGDVRIEVIDSDPDEQRGGQGMGGSGSDQGGEAGGGSNQGDAGGLLPNAPFNQAQRTPQSQPDAPADAPDEVVALGGRAGEHVRRQVQRAHAQANAAVAARPARAPVRRASGGTADNLSGGRDLERDRELGFVSSGDLEVKVIQEAARVAAIDPDAQGKGGGGLSRSASASGTADDAAPDHRRATVGATSPRAPVSARALDRTRANLPTSLAGSPELASLRRAVLDAGTPQARAQVLTHALFVLSASRARPGPLSADAAQLVVMAAFLQAPAEPGPPATREDVKNALLAQGPPAVSALPASTAVRDRLALLPLKLLVCHQQRTDTQRQVAAERMLAGVHWPVTLKGKEA